ncbi:MAG: hypothetical protein ACTSRY_00180 [Alphaproteobacteria bacterium]
MLRDNSLIPSENIRLAALGELSMGPRTYGDLALAVRHFTGHLVGPSLDLMGTSIELLRLEGLIAASDGAGGDVTAETPLVITDAGMTELKALLAAQIRAPFNEIGRLSLALTLRFLHLLDAGDRRAQMDAAIDACDGEIARLTALRAELGDGDGLLPDWLDHDIAATEDRRAWFRARRATV